MAIEKIFSESVYPQSNIAKNMTRLELLLDIFPRDQLNLIFTLTNVGLQRKISLETTKWEMIIFLGSYFNHAL